MRVGRLGIVALSAIGLACGSAPNVPSLTPDATPDQVLTAYLTTVKGGNCAGASTFETVDQTSSAWCQNVQMEHFGPLVDAGSFDRNNAEYCLPITAHGVDGATMNQLCFVLTRQVDGRWLVSSAGAGP